MLLAQFIFLHELGHIVDYMEHGDDLAVIQERRRREMQTLPVPGFNPAKLANYISMGQFGADRAAHNQARLTQQGITYCWRTCSPTGSWISLTFL